MNIIFEDNDLLVLNKGAGAVVNRATSVKVPTIQDEVEAYLADDAIYQADLRSDPVFAERSGMAHRLDKDTSGVLVFTKNAAAMHQLLEQFRERDIQKTYLALVHGYLPTPRGIIRAAIERHPTQRERFTVAAEGRASETEFAVQKEYQPLSSDDLFDIWQEQGGGDRKTLERWLSIYQGFSLVELQPHTGRTHQIRVHLQWFKHPIVGDSRYVGRKRVRVDALWCPRQFLHAAALTLQHPHTGETMTFTAPLASDLAAVLVRLKGV